MSEQEANNEIEFVEARAALFNETVANRPSSTTRAYDPKVKLFQVLYYTYSRSSVLRRITVTMIR
jgi:hypothetical protein